MKSATKVLLILSGLGMTLGATAQDKIKPWMQWTVKDAEKILYDSGWGQTQTNSVISAQMDVQKVNLRVHFLSAKPIRQAILRIMELASPKASPEQIQEAWALVDRTFDKTIVVAVTYDGNDPGMIGPVFQALAGGVTATLKNNTYLEIKGGRRLFLQEYQPPSGDGLGAKFIFSRFFEDKTFIDPKADWVRFFARFPAPSLIAGTTWNPTSGASGQMEGSRPLTINVRFKIADFECNGVMVY